MCRIVFNLSLCHFRLSLPQFNSNLINSLSCECKKKMSKCNWSTKDPVITGFSVLFKLVIHLFKHFRIHLAIYSSSNNFGYQLQLLLLLVLFLTVQFNRQKEHYFQANWGAVPIGSIFVLNKFIKALYKLCLSSPPTQSRSCLQCSSKWTIFHTSSLSV